MSDQKPVSEETMKAAIKALTLIFQMSDRTRFIADLLSNIKAASKDNQDIQEKIGALEKIRSGIKSGAATDIQEIYKKIKLDIISNHHKGETLLADLVIGSELVVKNAETNNWGKAVESGRYLSTRLCVMQNALVDEIKPYEEIFETIKSEDFHIVYKAMGISFLNLGHLGEAEEAFLKAIKCSTNKIDLYLQLSKVQAKNNHLEAAYSTMQTAMNIAGDDPSPDCLFQMSFVCIYLQKLGEAKSWAELCLKKDPNRIEALNNLGLIYELQNNDEAALSWYSKAREIEPAHPIAIANCERVQQKLRR